MQFVELMNWEYKKKLAKLHKLFLIDFFFVVMCVIKRAYIYISIHLHTGFSSITVVYCFNLL